MVFMYHQFSETDFLLQNRGPDSFDNQEPVINQMEENKKDQPETVNPKQFIFDSSSCKKRGGGICVGSSLTGGVMECPETMYPCPNFPGPQVPKLIVPGDNVPALIQP